MTRIVIDQKEKIGSWVAEQVGQKTSWGDFNAFGIVKDDKILAGVVIHNSNGSNAVCHIAVLKRTKLLPSLFGLFCYYAFNICKLRRLTAFLPSHRSKVISFVKHLGFEEEFVMKDACKNSDMQGFVMWPSKCRWLAKG
jgi:hypothetical protein